MTPSPSSLAMQTRLALNAEMAEIRDKMNAALKANYLASMQALIVGNGQLPADKQLPIANPPLAWILMPYPETADDILYDHTFNLPGIMAVVVGTEPVCPKVVVAGPDPKPIPGTTISVGPFENAEERVVNGNPVEVSLFAAMPSDNMPAGTAVMWHYQGRTYDLFKRTRVTPFGTAQWYEGVAV